MALDGIFINFLVNEISEKLIGSKVDKVHQPTKNELVLLLRSKQGMHKLFLTADANAPRFHLIENAPENPPRPPNTSFLIVLCTCCFISSTALYPASISTPAFL